MKITEKTTYYFDLTNEEKTTLKKAKEIISDICSNLSGGELSVDIGWGDYDQYEYNELIYIIDALDGLSECELEML